MENESMVTLTLKEYNELRDFRSEMMKNNIMIFSEFQNFNSSKIYVGESESIRRVKVDYDKLLTELDKLSLELRVIKSETKENFLKMSLYKFWGWKRLNS